MLWALAATLAKEHGVFRTAQNLLSRRLALDRARQQPIGETDYQKLKIALDVLDERLRANRTTEKTRKVVDRPKLARGSSRPASHTESPASQGHGRNAADAYTGAMQSIRESVHQLLEDQIQRIGYQQRRPTGKLSPWS